MGGTAPAGPEPRNNPPEGPRPPVPAQHGIWGSPWGWQEPLGLSHGLAVPATSLSAGKTLLLLAALFEKLFTKMLQAVKGDPQAFSKLTAYSFLEKGVKINKLASGKGRSLLTV